MKILYFHQYFNFPSGNGSTRSYDLAKQYVQNGHEVTFITTSAFLSGRYTKRWTILEEDGIKLYVLKSNYSNNKNTHPYSTRIENSNKINSNGNNLDHDTREIIKTIKPDKNPTKFYK